MKKKLLALILSLSMVLSLVACAPSSGAPTAGPTGSDTTDSPGESAEPVKAEWPTGNVMWYSTNAAGNPGNMSETILTDYFSQVTGQAFVLTSEPTGGGIVCLETVTKARPDGYTLMSVMGGMLVNYLTETTDINILDKDKAILIPAGTYVTREYGSMIVARADTPYNTWQEFVDYVAAHPGEVKWGTPDNGNAELKCYALIDHYGMDVNVLYGSSPDLVTAILGDRMDVALISPSTALQYFESGDMKPLIMDLTEEYKGDDPVLAEVETYVDYGIEDLLISPPNAVLLPANTDEAVVAAITDFLVGLRDRPDVNEINEQLKPLNTAIGGLTTQKEVYAEMQAYYDMVSALIDKYY